MRILVDMDGVLANCNKHLISLLNRYFNENLKLEDIKGWDIEDYCKNAKREHVKDFFAEAGFFKYLEPIEGALEGIQLLMTAGHDVCILTACKHGNDDKRYWLNRNLPKFDQRNLIFSERKETVCGDVLIDDGIHNLDAWSKEWPDGLPICFAQPHNYDYWGNRANDWERVLQLINVKFQTSGEISRKKRTRELPPPSKNLFTQRELEVFQNIADNDSDIKRIADDLCISVHTVKVHKHNVYQKLGVAGMTEALVMLVRMKLIEV